MRLRQFIPFLLKSRGKFAFLRCLSPNSRILDVGCGNNSSYRFKDAIPLCHYTGIDIGDCNQTQPNMADEYVITTPEYFSSAISGLRPAFDAVISAHNIEHVDNRVATLEAMMGVVKPGGALYIAFPCQASVDFPRRGGLCYFDDETHKPPPPDPDAILHALRTGGFEITYFARRYRPVLLWTLGLLVEPLSRALRRALIGSHEFYGVETLIWARKAGS